MSFLPPELLCVILDFVARVDGGYCKTIKSCALVSRIWCTYSRPYIFRNLEISVSKKETETWVERCRESPHLIPLIYHLTLACVKKENEDCSDWQADVAEELGRQMAHVRSLTLSNLTYERRIQDLEPHTLFVKHLGSAVGGLHSIQLNYIHFEKPDQLFRYLGSIPGRQSNLSIKIAGTYNLDEGAYEDSGLVAYKADAWQQPGYTLDHLVLYTTELRTDVLSWLLSPAVDLSALQDLVIAPSFISGVQELGTAAKPLFAQLISTVGSSVQRLTLATNREDTIDFTAHDIRKFRALERLMLISEHESGLTAAAGLSQILSLLPGLKSHPSLTKIILAVDLDLYSTQGISDLGALRDWRVLDEQLDTATATIPTFRQLFVLVEVTDMVTESDETEGERLDMVAEVVRGAMPRLAERGLLAIRAEEYWSSCRVKLLYHSWTFDHELMI